MLNSVNLHVFALGTAAAAAAMVAVGPYQARPARTADAAMAAPTLGASEPELYSPHATPAPSLEEERRRSDAVVMARDMSRAPPAATITVVNRLPIPISTYYAHNAGGPGLVAGDMMPGTMAVAETASIVVPTGWAGNIQMGSYLFPIGDAVSMVEASFMVQEGVSEYAVLDIDVSYVNGFSVPITCSCNIDQKVLTGCSIDLWTHMACPDPAPLGACPNPNRPHDKNGLVATAFFYPCEGAAFTWPRDPGNSNGECQSGEITCCVGTFLEGCPVNPKQKSILAREPDPAEAEVVSPAPPVESPGLMPHTVLDNAPAALDPSPPDIQPAPSPEPIPAAQPVAAVGEQQGHGEILQSEDGKVFVKAGRAGSS